MNDTKWCPGCLLRHPIEAFAKAPRNKIHDGWNLRIWCKEYENQHSRDWYHRNKEKRTKTIVAYHKTKKGRKMVIEAVKRYKKKYPEKAAAWQNAYYHRIHPNAKYLK